MKKIIIPVLVSILILGSFGFTQDVYGPQVKGLKEKVHFPAIHLEFFDIDGSPVAGAECFVEIKEGGQNSHIHKAVGPTNKNGKAVAPSVWIDFEPQTVQGICVGDDIRGSSDVHRVADGEFWFLDVRP